MNNIFKNTIVYPTHEVVCKPSHATPKAMEHMCLRLEPTGTAEQHRMQLDNHNAERQWAVLENDGTMWVMDEEGDWYTVFSKGKFV